jgi:hypothetical protein
MPSKRTRELRELERRYDEFYEKYGKPLEAEQRGEFLTVSATGETLYQFGVSPP